MTIISVTGFISSGKDTLAKYLVEEYGFVQVSFGESLKDVVAAMFGFDRTMLEGSGKDYRVEREKVDTWWANKLGIPEFSPRWALQHIGTDTMRRRFNSDIWVLSLENKLRKYEGQNIIVSDARFPNELSAIKKYGGVCVCVTRGNWPEWYQSAAEFNAATEKQKVKLRKRTDIPNVFDFDIHESEWAWIGTEFDATIANDGSISDLKDSVDRYIQMIATD